MHLGSQNAGVKEYSVAKETSAREFRQMTRLFDHRIRALRADHLDVHLKLIYERMGLPRGGSCEIFLA